MNTTTDTPIPDPLTTTSDNTAPIVDTAMPEVFVQPLENDFNVNIPMSLFHRLVQVYQQYQQCRKNLPLPETSPVFEWQKQVLPVFQKFSDEVRDANASPSLRANTLFQIMRGINQCLVDNTDEATIVYRCDDDQASQIVAYSTCMGVVLTTQEHAKEDTFSVRFCFKYPPTQFNPNV